MTFDVTTNRIPFGLLTPEEQKELKAWPHGHEVLLKDRVWVKIDTPSCGVDVVYRGKPAPKVTSYWFNVYPEGYTGIRHATKDEALSSHGGRYTLALVRLDICNGEVTVTKET